MSAHQKLRTNIKLFVSIALAIALGYYTSPNALPSDFGKQEASKKMEVLWDNGIQFTESAPWKSRWEQARMNIPPPIGISLDYVNQRIGEGLDEPDRPKPDTAGWHAQMSVEIIDKRFSGLFGQDKIDNCIGRNSTAFPPYWNVGHSPALALKCFIDGKDSANFVSLHAAKGFKDQANPLNYILSTHVNRDGFTFSVNGLLSAIIHGNHSNYGTPNMIGLSQFVGQDMKGKKPDTINGPFSLVFRPTAEARNQCQKKLDDPNFAEFNDNKYACIEYVNEADIDEADLYEIWAELTPTWRRTADCEKLKKIGVIKTRKSRDKDGKLKVWHASSYFDKLHFTHTFWKDEVNLVDNVDKKDWLDIADDGDFETHAGPEKWIDWFDNCGF